MQTITEFTSLLSLITKIVMLDRCNWQQEEFDKIYQEYGFERLLHCAHSGWHDKKDVFGLKPDQLKKLISKLDEKYPKDEYPERWLKCL